ncbi:MAG: hypothetical protein Q8P81_01440 [Nanoarchaeota archaeon]|nr:hypothetical protein [Nanoarchaeota archaeon]
MKIIIIAVLALALIGGLFVFYLGGNEGIEEEIISYENNSENLNQYNLSSAEVEWSFDRENGEWISSGEVPSCPEPLIIESPVDASLASSLLYPGQTRGGDYKSHGGFRFDNRITNDVEVRAVLDGYIFRASKYDDGYAVQNMLFQINDCGIMAKYDHLLTLSPKFSQIFEDLPLGQNGDSRTTEISPRVPVKKGEVIATEIGYENFPGGHEGKNIFVDFGLYDLRKKNGVVYSEEFRAQHANIDEDGAHALCWFDYLEEPAKSIVRNLSMGGFEKGEESDYCS